VGDGKIVIAEGYDLVKGIAFVVKKSLKRCRPNWEDPEAQNL
jgi:hypothetical protein